MNNSQDIDTSLIIPAYNESPIIEDTILRLSSYINKHRRSLGNTEIIIVATGTDDTAKVASALKSKVENLRVVNPGHKRGKGLAVRLGFDNAIGDIQIFMDADLATPIHHLKDTVRMLRTNSDVVIGVRKLSKIHPGKLRTLFSLGSNLITRFLLFPLIKDTQCGYKGFTKDAAHRVFTRQRLLGWGFDIELLQLAKENKLKITQQRIYDWQEEREEGLRGDGLLGSGLKTLADLIIVRVESWGRYGSRHYKTILGLFMLASFGVAMFIGLKQSVWFDEGYSIALAKSSLSDLLSFTSVDAHPPLYYLILKGWASVFGYSEFALRALSALFGALSLGAMSLLIKKMFSKPAAVVSLPFILLAPFLMRYNFEIRMYSLVSLLVVCATYVMIKAKESAKTIDWLIYGLIIATGMYTLYMSILVWGAHLAYLAYYTIKNKKPLFKQKFIIGFGFAVLLFVPYIPTMIGQFQHSALPSITSQVGFSELATVLSFGMLYQPNWQVSAIMALPLFIFFVALIKQVAANFGTSRKLERSHISLMLVIFLGPIAFLALISIIRPYFLERYLVHYIIFAYALIGITLDSAWRKGRHLGSIVLASSSLLLVCFGILNLNKSGNFNYQNLSRPSSKEVSQVVGECNTLGSQKTIVADDPFAYIDSAYYYEGCDLRFFSKDELGEYGGYVPLRFSNARVESPQAVSASTIYHLHWESETLFKIAQDPRYELISKTRINKHSVDEYRLKD